ncbi:septal ring lytic transglycosylase RlpA family protein [Neolewinella persica]|uniref:septal ring lytic transglycosylase RlpA family protein n=1 Tax=Neolewinella persica TaxID=70998 RepID=UPI00039B3776|nr:septal ring lytic transglycosylase RlpA family protein [Neolewinella persica]
MRIILILTFFCLTSPLLTAQLVGDKENGLASYYSNQYQGAETAYGVIYDKNELVAAHRVFPQNSVVKVENMENGKTVNVRIIDKGPFIPGRLIELSERAAANLGMIGKSTVQVELTLLSTPDQPARAVTTTSTAEEEAREKALEVANNPIVNEPAPTPAERQPVITEPRPAPAAAPAPVKEAPKATSPPVAQSSPTPTVTTSASQVKALPVSSEQLVRTATFAPGTYKIALLKPTGGKYGVQVGSFKDLEGAMDKVTELQSKWFDNILIERLSTGPGSVYKVILGPFETEKSAQRYSSDLKTRYKIPGFMVTIK